MAIPLPNANTHALAGTPVEQVRSVRDAAQVGPDVDRLGHEQRAGRRGEQPSRIFRPQCASQPAAGHQPNSRAHHLYRRHRRPEHGRGSEKLCTELRAGDGVRRDPRRIVVGGAGNDAGPERSHYATKSGNLEPGVSASSHVAECSLLPACTEKTRSGCLCDVRRRTSQGAVACAAYRVDSAGRRSAMRAFTCVTASPALSNAGSSNKQRRPGEYLRSL